MVKRFSERRLLWFGYAFPFSFLVQGCRGKPKKKTKTRQMIISPARGSSAWQWEFRETKNLRNPYRLDDETEDVTGTASSWPTWNKAAKRGPGPPWQPSRSLLGHAATSSPIRGHVSTPRRTAHRRVVGRARFSLPDWLGHRDSKQCDGDGFTPCAAVGAGLTNKFGAFC
jgi:hypothetical protein